MGLFKKTNLPLIVGFRPHKALIDIGTVLKQAAVRHDKGGIFSAGRPMNLTRQQGFSCSRGARDKNTRIQRAHLGHGGLKLLDKGGMTHKGILGEGLCFQMRIFLQQKLHLKYAVQNMKQFFCFKGFFNDVFRALLHGLDGDFYGGMAAHHHDGQRRTLGFKQHQKLQTIPRAAL